jgi:hypothetical protein
VPAPTLTPTAERLLDSLGPLDADAAANDYVLQHFVSVLALGWDTVAEVIRDREDGRPGFAVLFDPDECPGAFLEWAAQFVGVVMLPGLTEAQQQLRIRETGGARRGTPQAIEGAAKQFLVGPGGTGDTAAVYIVERHGSPYELTVYTLDSQTPDATSVRRGLLDQKPAGLRLNYVVIAAGTYAALLGAHASYTDVLADFATYDALRADPTHT